MRKLTLLIPLLIIFTVNPLLKATRRRGLLQCLRIKDPQERLGCITIISTMQAIEQLDNAINRILEKLSSTRRKKSEIEVKLEEIKKIKKKYGIDKLSKQIEELDKELTNIAARTFAQGSASYKKISNIIKTIVDDLEVRSKMNEIIKLKQEIKERLEKKITQVQELGKKVVQQTKDAQEELNTFKREKYLPVKQKLTTNILKKELDEELDTVHGQIINLEAELNRELSEVLTSQEKRNMELLKAAIARLEIMLKFIQDPEKIPTASADELLGLAETGS